MLMNDGVSTGGWKEDVGEMEFVRVVAVNANVFWNHFNLSTNECTYNFT